MTHEELCGTNTLEEVFSTGGDEQAVVRWCYWCGAVVVDIDYDGRTNPGGFMPMRFPEKWLS